MRDGGRGKVGVDLREELVQMAPVFVSLANKLDGRLLDVCKI